MSLHVVPLLGAENALFKTIGEIFHPLFVAIATVLAYIYDVVPSYAGAIAILTVVIMVLLTPLTVKSTRSMVAMQALQPEMQKLRQKYKGAENREQLNQEMMRLYRENGVSPTGGCLPMFLQMPALIVLYDIIEGLANTVKKGAALATLGPTGKHLICQQTVCATPRYIPHSSSMYHNLVQTPGVMDSFGMNFAAKPLTHHGDWYGYVPYFVLIAAAVGLQYFQMAQMTRRNKTTKASVPQQMQTMQRVMPLVFAYIYFIVPAGVALYMVVSSGIRVITQDVIFRYGLVPLPGERQIGSVGEAAPARGGGLLGRLGGGSAALGPGGATGEKTTAGRAGARDRPGGEAPGGGRASRASPGTGSVKGETAPRRPEGGRRPEVNGAGSGGGSGQKGTPARGNVAGRGARGRAQAPGSTQGGTGAAQPKPHPRSKSKRARKAR